MFVSIQPPANIVGMCVCVCICVCVCLCMSVYVCVCVGMCVYVCMYMSVCVWACVYMCVCMCMCICVCMCGGACVYMCVYVCGACVCICVWGHVCVFVCVCGLVRPNINLCESPKHILYSIMYMSSRNPEKTFWDQKRNINYFEGLPSLPNINWLLPKIICKVLFYYKKTSKEEVSFGLMFLWTN